MSKILNNYVFVICLVFIGMLVYFLFGTPRMMDDGWHYEQFAESLARGKLDFKSYYGFQGLSFFAVPVFWLTHSDISIIITSMIFTLLSIPLAYLTGRDYYQSKRAGIYFLTLFLLMPYPYVTLMRGFQEAALLFFVLLITYGAIHKKIWTPLAWAVGGIVKPFALVLAPLFIKDFLNRKRIWWLASTVLIGLLYVGASYYQTGSLINNAVTGSYQGSFNAGDIPEIGKSFGFSLKSFLRIGANLFIQSRKINISPVVALIGFLSLLVFKFRFRKEIILAIILNVLLVGSFIFSFPKYLIPMVVLAALASVKILLEKKWLMFLVFVDSLLVFITIYNGIGHNFWTIKLFYLPYLYAIILFLFSLIRTRKIFGEY